MEESDHVGCADWQGFMGHVTALMSLLLQWIWDGLPGHDAYENWVLSEWQVPSDALKQQYLLPKLKAVQ